MCGIAGIVRPLGISPKDQAWGKWAAHELQHRGPDRQASKTTSDQKAVFAHARLSIIDLTSAGDQPMVSEDGLRTLVFNGEIYNYKAVRAQLESLGHRFRTSSDTEVLLVALEAWDHDACSHLEGMFAFALHDSRSGSLILGRDRAGQKPLYRASLPDGAVAFASELQVLLSLKDSWSLSRMAVEEYLRLGYTWDRQTLVSGVERVAPATVEEWVDGHQSITTYWTLPSPPTEPAPTEVLLQELDALMQKAVERTLVSDVPVGILLSGGVDSSLVAAYAARTQPDVRTFTVSFAGSHLDEGGEAAQISSALGLPHMEIQGAELGFAQVVDAIASQDEPIADPSVIPTMLLAAEVAKHVRVALGGDGGDELFGGYLHYRHLSRLSEPSWRTFEVPRRHLAASTLRLAPRGVRGRFFLELGARSSTTVGPPLGSIFHSFEINGLLNSRSSVLTQWPNMLGVGEDLVDSTMRMDFHHYLPNDILHKIDRSAMHYALETRSPMLDSDLVAFAFGRVGNAQKVAGSDAKILLKLLRSQILGSRDSLNRKQGFSPPLANLVSNQQVRRFILQMFERAPSETWNHRELQRWAKHLGRGARVAHQCFALACLIEWQIRVGINEVKNDD